jgi:hypothetical protein
MLDEIDPTRRRFLGTAAMTLAAAQLGMLGSADAHGSAARGSGWAVRPGASTSFGPLRQIDAGVLSVGIGHNLPQEAPKAFADAIREVDGY